MPAKSMTTAGGYRSYGADDQGGRRLRPLIHAGYYILAAAMGTASKQVVGRLARGMKPVRCCIIAPSGVTIAAAGTFRLDLEAVTTPSLALVNLVAAATAITPANLAFAAGFGASYAADRDISITPAGGTAGQTLTIALECIPELSLLANS